MRRSRRSAALTRRRTARSATGVGAILAPPCALQSWFSTQNTQGGVGTNAASTPTGEITPAGFTALGRRVGLGAADSFADRPGPPGGLKRPQRSPQ